MKNKKKEQKKSKTTTILTLSVIALLLIGTILVFVLDTTPPAEPPTPTEYDEVSPTEIKQIVEAFVQTNMFGAENAIITDVRDEGYLYLLEFNLDGVEGGEIVMGFATKDGRFFLPAGYEITTPTNTEPVITSSDDLKTLNDLELSDEKINLVYFWGDGCGFCDMMNEFLEDMDEKYPDMINLLKFETWQDPSNTGLMLEISENYNHNPQGVPLIFLGNQVYIGASDAVFENIENKIVACIEDPSGCELKI